MYTSLHEKGLDCLMCVVTRTLYLDLIMSGVTIHETGGYMYMLACLNSKSQTCQEHSKMVSITLYRYLLSFLIVAHDHPIHFFILAAGR